MSRRFNGTTDRINVGSEFPIDNIGGSPGSRSIVSWFYMTTWGEDIGGTGTRAGRLWDKHSAIPAGSALFVYDDGPGTTGTAPRFSCGVQVYGSTIGRAFAVDSSIATGSWTFLASTYKPGDGGPRLYLGSLATPSAEVSYSARSGVTRQDVVTYTSDAAEIGSLGNRVDTARTFEGWIGHMSVWNGSLSLAHLELLRVQPHLGWRRVTTGSCLGVWGNDERWPLAIDRSGLGSHGLLSRTEMTETDRELFIHQRTSLMRM